MRGKNGEILFAYSRYHGDSVLDNAPSDIAMIVSHDEGENWSEEQILVRAAEFGVQNVMSVSAVEQQNGDIAFYFLINESNGDSSLGRTVSADGKVWRTERCVWDVPAGFYVVNNDRIVRLKDGTLVAPASFCSAEEIKKDYLGLVARMDATALISKDDGKTFTRVPWLYSVENPAPWMRGFEEPGIIEFPDHLYYWMRTGLGCQYESASNMGINGFFAPRPSVFTSPESPMQIKAFDGVAYAIYNPIPKYNGRVSVHGAWGRTPYVLRRSTDHGKTWGPLNTIEDDPSRGYCYPAIFKTRDNCLLLAYCRGNLEDGNPLCRIGISKVEIASIE